MSAPRDHAVFRELLPMAALDALSSEERAELDAHLATCAECRREVADLRDVTGSIAASLPARPLSPERDSLLRARLMARAVADREDVTPIRSAAPTSHVPASRARTAPWGWLAAASLLLALAALGYGARQRAAGNALVADLSRYSQANEALRRQLAEQKAIVEALTGPGVRVIDAAATSAREPYARMFWDQPANRWTFVAYNLPAATAGHTYQLWLVTRDQKKVSAGTFTPDERGSALVRATYALSGDSLAAIAVTNEPAGGSAQPTTTPFLVGAVAKSD
jgi:anti-sigma-K factor RskA